MLQAETVKSEKVWLVVLLNVSTRRNKDDLVLREENTPIGFMKEKRHMNQLFTRPLTTEKNQKQNTAALNLLSFLLAYKSWFMWHMFQNAQRRQTI